MGKHKIPQKAPTQYRYMATISWQVEFVGTTPELASKMAHSASMSFSNPIPSYIEELETKSKVIYVDKLPPTVILNVPDSAMDMVDRDESPDMTKLQVRIFTMCLGGRNQDDVVEAIRGRTKIIPLETILFSIQDLIRKNMLEQSVFI